MRKNLNIHHLSNLEEVKEAKKAMVMSYSTPLLSGDKVKPKEVVKDY